MGKTQLTPEELEKRLTVFEQVNGDKKFDKLVKLKTEMAKLRDSTMSAQAKGDLRRRISRSLIDFANDHEYGIGWNACLDATVYDQPLLRGSFQRRLTIVRALLGILLTKMTNLKEAQQMHMTRLELNCKTDEDSKKLWYYIWGNVGAWLIVNETLNFVVGVVMTNVLHGALCNLAQDATKAGQGAAAESMREFVLECNNIERSQEPTQVLHAAAEQNRLELLALGWCHCRFSHVHLLWPHPWHIAAQQKFVIDEDEPFIPERAEQVLANDQMLRSVAKQSHRFHVGKRSRAQTFHLSRFFVF